MAAARLREVRPQEDAPAHYLLWSDPEVLKFTPELPSLSQEDSLQSLRRIHSWFASHRYTISWAIALKEDDRYIGAIGLYEFLGYGLSIAQTSFSLGREHWNRGMATEALREGVTFGFDRLWLRRIQMLVHPEHKAAIRAAGKAGFQEEGTLRQCLYNERTGGWEDQRLLAILRGQQAPAGGVTPSHG